MEAYTVRAPERPSSRPTARVRGVRAPALTLGGAALLVWLSLILAPQRRDAEVAEQRMAAIAPATTTPPRRVSLTQLSKPGVAVASQPVERAAAHNISITQLPPLTRPAHEANALWDATQRLVAACMRARGFAYEPALFDDTEDHEADSNLPVLGDIDAARGLGYGLALDIERAHEGAPEPSEPAAVSKLSPEARRAYVEALVGPPVLPEDRTETAGFARVALPGGGEISWFRTACYPQAHEAIYGADMRHNELGPAH